MAAMLAWMLSEAMMCTFTHLILPTRETDTERFREKEREGRTQTDRWIDAEMVDDK